MQESTKRTNQVDENRDDYRQILVQELALRCERQPSYNLRKFADELGIPSSQLSHILNRRYGLSMARAKKMSDILEFSDQRKLKFLLSVESQHARNLAQRMSARKRLNLLVDKESEATNRATITNEINNWYEFALLELISCDNFKNDDEWIANKFDISTEQARQARERLLQHKLIEPSGWGLVKRFDALEFKEDKRKHQIFNQVSRKIEELVEKAPSANQVVETIVVPFDPHRMGEIREEVLRFKQRVSQISKRYKGQKEVLSVCLSAAPITGGTSTKDTESEAV